VTFLNLRIDQILHKPLVQEVVVQNSYYLGKDKQTKWYAPSKNVRTRQRNIVLRLPGVKQIGRGDPNSILERWNLFFSNSIIDDIVKYNNIYLDKICSKYIHVVRMQNAGCFRLIE